MKPKKQRKAEVVEVRFRLLTDATNANVKMLADLYAMFFRHWLGATITKQPTIERVGKR